MKQLKRKESIADMNRRGLQYRARARACLQDAERIIDEAFEQLARNTH